MTFANYLFSNDGWTETHYGNEQTLTINRGNDESKFCVLLFFFEINIFLFFCPNKFKIKISSNEIFISNFF